MTRLRSFSGTLVEKGTLISVCAYGSRVAGYARKDSEFDLIVVARDFKDGVRYLPPKGASEPSALIVDEATLRKQASDASSDEFVVGRLLNVYHPILNPEFLRRVEFTYKKRVMAEALIKLQSNYLDFSPNLIIPYEYFLFDRLHQRALTYPSTVYSFASTYTCRKSKENLEFSLRGFREASGFLVSHGIIESTGDSVRVPRGKTRALSLARLLRMFPQTAAGAMEYIATGVSSKIGIQVAKTEALAEMGERKGKVKPLIELDRPKTLLRLAEGVVFDDPERMVDQIARMSGFRGSYEFKKKQGSVINASEVLEIWSKGRRAKFVLKQFPELKSIKWVLLNLWGLAAKKFNMTPIGRLQREYEGVFRLRELGIRTHRIVGIALDERTLVTEYVEGAPLSDSVEKVLKGEAVDVRHVEEYGQVLAKLHKAGLVFGDTKAQNVLVTRRGIELIDLEQAVENGDQAWDLAEFLYYAAKTALNEGGMKTIAEAFLKGYLAQGSERVVAKARDARYMAPFLPFVYPTMTGVIRDALKEYGSAASSGSGGSG